jgi:DNA primase
LQVEENIKLHSGTDECKNSLGKIPYSEDKEYSASLAHYNPTSYKAIHYERQPQLKLKHVFDLRPLYENLPLWCSRAPRTSTPADSFTLRLEFLLPDRRKIKRDSLVFDLVSTKEYEAAQHGLMYARALFDTIVGELYTYKGITFKKGLQIGPSWIENGVKTCALLSLSACSNRTAISDIFVFATHVIFSAEDLHHMQAINIALWFNDTLLGSMDIGIDDDTYDYLEFARKFYSNAYIQKMVYSTVKNRNILYAFREEKARLGMMVKTGAGWDPVEIKTREDIYHSVLQHNVVEFIPAVNRASEEYPSIITIETDPGDVLVRILGKEKSWKFNTYITEKICRVLDTYKIRYMVKFSGNKGWHIQIPIELTEPFKPYQQVVEAIVNRDLCGLPREEQMLAMMLNFVQLEDVKSYKDPFFVARRFVDLVGAHIMFYELEDIHKVLESSDLKRLLLRVNPVCREDLLRKGSGIYETERGPVKAEIPQILSINPYSKFRRQFKLLIDHSSNKREGKLRSVFSLHSKTGLVSIPASLHKDEKGLTRFDRSMWSYSTVRQSADAERVYNHLEREQQDSHLFSDPTELWKINSDVKGFGEFLEDHKGLLVYLLQNGGEALELLDAKTALWVNAVLWKKYSQFDSV